MTNPQNNLKTNKMFQISLAQIQIQINKQTPEEEKKVLNKVKKKPLFPIFIQRRIYLFLGEYFQMIINDKII